MKTTAASSLLEESGLCLWSGGLLLAGLDSNCNSRDPRRRVRKTSLPRNAVFRYSVPSMLIAEKDVCGQVRKEYLYPSEIPVAVNPQ